MSSPKKAKKLQDNLEIVQNELEKTEDQLRAIQNQLVELIHELQLPDEEN